MEARHETRKREERSLVGGHGRVEEHGEVENESEELRLASAVTRELSKVG